jgi:hypothetical protein
MVNRYLSIIISAFVILSANSIYGQVKKNIDFKPGQKSMVVSGRLTRRDARDHYSIELKKGQRLYIQIISSNRTLGFNLDDPMANKIGSPGDEEWYWEDEVTSDGVYWIEVYALKGIGKYKMIIKLK